LSYGFHSRSRAVATQNYLSLRVAYFYCAARMMRTRYTCVRRSGTTCHVICFRVLSPQWRTHAAGMPTILYVCVKVQLSVVNLRWRIIHMCTYLCAHTNADGLVKGKQFACGKCSKCVNVPGPRHRTASISMTGNRYIVLLSSSLRVGVQQDKSRTHGA
jgi:hypothetical protein